MAAIGFRNERTCYRLARNHDGRQREDATRHMRASDQAVTSEQEQLQSTIKHRQDERTLRLLCSPHRVLRSDSHQSHFVSRHARDVWSAWGSAGLSIRTCCALCRPLTPAQQFSEHDDGGRWFRLSKSHARPHSGRDAGPSVGSSRRGPGKATWSRCWCVIFKLRA